MAARFTYHGSPFYNQIQQQGFKSGTPTNSLSLGNKPVTFADLFQKGSKTFTSTSPSVASMYGKTTPVVSSTSNISLPSGAINKSGVRFGTEVIQTPQQATKGMNLANKIGTTYTGPTSQRLASGATVSGLGGAGSLSGIGTAAKTAFSLPMTAGAIAQQGLYNLNKPTTQAGYDYAQNLDRNSISSIADETAGLDYQQDYMQGVMDADKNYLGAEQTKSPIAENDLTNYNEHYNMLPEEEKEGFLSFLQNAGVNTRDFVMDNAARYGGAKMGSSLATSIFGLNPISAIAGAIGGGIFGNRFTNQPYIGAGSLYDGAGGFSAAQLDRQNALGGYYSDAARNQRSQANRVGNLIDRAASGQNFSRTNLKNLGGFTDNQIDDIVGGSTQISPGTFTKESIDQSFAGEEGPTGGSSSGSTGYDGGQASSKGDEDMAYGGRAGYRDGGYSSEDNEEQQAQDQASFDAGNRTDDYNDMYSGDNNNSVNNINIPTGTSNLDFSMVKDINPAFSYANNVGRFGGMLDTTKTIEEEEPVGTMGYFSPSGNFGIGYDTNLGMVSNANLGNLNIGYTGQDGVNASYMGGFANDAGRFGVNYGKDGLNLGLRFEKNFNNGGIVGLYR